MKGSTIAAIATSIGPGGIGIVKISGPISFSIALSIFRKHCKLSSVYFSILQDKEIIPRHLYHGVIVHPDTHKIIDEVLLVFMKSPDSYTCEDVVEIQAHSGFVVLESLLELVLKQGAELAQPGEFTRRAFMNGRIDIFQAEAVMDLINSRSEKARDISVSQLFGAMTQRTNIIRDELLQIVSLIEASIDFPDDTDGPVLLDIQHRLEIRILNPILKLIQRHKEFRYIRDGYRISIVGRPNVGKSSLMNRLINKSRAIVTDIPGTTRDIVNENVIFKGIPVCFSDTAGIHSTHDVIELLGIDRTYEAMYASDLILLVIDASMSDFDQEHRILDIVGLTPVLLVINKIDLITDPANMMLSERLSRLLSVQISVTSDLYIDILADQIGKYTRTAFSCSDVDDVVPNLRQSLSLEKAAQCVQKAIDGIVSMYPLEMIEMDIRDALCQMDEISGVQISDEILDRIFNSFCIGK